MCSDTLQVKRELRLEGRGSGITLHGSNCWQIGRSNLSSPTLQIGDNSASFHQPLSLTQCTCSGDLSLNSKLKINSLDAMSVDGSNNCVFHRPCLFPNGFTSAGVCGFQNTVVMDDVQMNSLTTPAMNIQMSGLASHISVNDVSRIRFTRLDTQIHGGVSITGNLTVRGTGGGSKVD